ncbi:MAG: hypothetical protein K5928_04375 [Prevotella sp.]|nr:hypothetical protein [Prevotella sp.]
MKKLFTLLAAALAAATVSAQDVQTVFHWQCDGNVPTADAAITTTGGTLTATTTDANKFFSTESAAYDSSVPDDLKSKSSKAWKSGSNAAYLIIQLSEELQAGDKIEVCGYNPWIIATSIDWSNADITAELTTGSSKSDYKVGEVTVPDGVSASTIYMRRANGTGTGIAAIKITREVQTTGPFYAVVGSENLFGEGNSWNVATTTDYMTAGDDGIYTWSKQNVTLSENAELKVIKKENKEDAEAAAWYPGNNVTLDGWTKAASYNVTVTFDPANETVTAKAERIITIESMAIVGDFSPNGWEPAQGLAMTQDETKKNIWTLTIADFEAEVKTYEYKATANGVWDDYVLPEVDNAKWTPTAAAKYDLVFTVDTEKHELTLAAQKQSSVEIGKLYIVGEITGGWPTEATDGDDGWSMAKEMKQDAADANIWTLSYNAYITVEGDALTLKYKAAADKAWTFAIPQEGDNEYTFRQSGWYHMLFTANVAEKTLTLTAEMEQAPVFAENAIYAWQSPTGYAYEQGGEAASEGNINIVNDKYYTIRLNGKNDYSSDVVTITLNEGLTLKAGDEIAITAYRNKNEAGKKSGAKLRFDGSSTINIGDGLAFNNINTAVAETAEYGEPNTITATVPAEADGSSKIELTRSSTSTNLFITKIEITRPAEQIETMYIVGDFTGGWPTEAAEGTPADWSMAQAMTQDAENPNLWTLSVENFEVKFAEGETSKTYYYKATANQKWGLYELPAAGANNNWVFADGSDYPAGVYDLVFTADTEANTLTVVPTYDAVATGIASVQSVKPAQAIFNLAGQRVSGTQKGLYIVGGKKVVR